MTVEEALMMIKQSPSNKANFSGNYTEEFDKADSKPLAPFSLKMMKLTTSSGSCPLRLYKANIALVMKAEMKLTHQKLPTDKTDWNSAVPL